jgi:hypothetical protein
MRIPDLDEAMISVPSRLWIPAEMDTQAGAPSLVDWLASIFTQLEELTC